MIKNSQKCALLIDFDGTATQTDVGMGIFNHFSTIDPRKAINLNNQDEWIGSRLAYRILLPLLKGNIKQWADWAKINHKPDPGLKELTTYAKNAGWLIEILSDGLTFYIDAILKEYKIDLNIKAGLINNTNNRATAPHMNPLCGKCSTCKTQRINELKEEGYFVIFIGDGYSDLCGAPNAHQIYAKDILETHLKEKNIKYHPYKTLNDIIPNLF
jgi:2-hydroxy-3-keto-5-methylthiopentenyl-1-phosphate phosphatase